MKVPAWLQSLFTFALPDMKALKRRRRAAKLARWYRRDGRSRSTRPRMTAARVTAWRKVGLAEAAALRRYRAEMPRQTARWLKRAAQTPTTLMGLPVLVA